VIEGERGFLILEKRERARFQDLISAEALANDPREVLSGSVVESRRTLVGAEAFRTRPNSAFCVIEAKRFCDLESNGRSARGSQDFDKARAAREMIRAEK